MCRGQLRFLFARKSEKEPLSATFDDLYTVAQPGGGAQGARVPPPPSYIGGPHRTGILTFFWQNFTKIQRIIIFAE